MSEKALFTQEDCLLTGYDFSINSKVIVLHHTALPEECRDTRHQLYFCTGGNGSNPNPIGGSVSCVLDNGAYPLEA